MPFKVCPCGVAGACVVVLAAATGRGLLLERGRLHMLGFVRSRPWLLYEVALTYLVNGYGAGIVLVATLRVHQLGHECILPAIAG